MTATGGPLHGDTLRAFRIHPIFQSRVLHVSTFGPRPATGQKPATKKSVNTNDSDPPARTPLAWPSGRDVQLAKLKTGAIQVMLDVPEAAHREVIQPDYRVSPLKERVG